MTGCGKGQNSQVSGGSGVKGVHSLPLCISPLSILSFFYIALSIPISIEPIFIDSHPPPPCQLCSVVIFIKKIIIIKISSGTPVLINPLKHSFVIDCMTHILMILLTSYYWQVSFYLLECSAYFDVALVVFKAKSFANLILRVRVRVKFYSQFISLLNLCPPPPVSSPPFSSHTFSLCVLFPCPCPVLASILLSYWFISTQKWPFSSSSFYQVFLCLSLNLFIFDYSFSVGLKVRVCGRIATSTVPWAGMTNLGTYL